MTSISFSINAWNAWLPGVTTEAHWQQWLQSPTASRLGEPFKATTLKPMLRRRLSRLGHIALSTAAPLTENYPKLASLFCSRHGELERTVSLLKDSAQQRPLSPTHFSLSVHNAIGGIYSMAYQNTAAINAIACEDGDTSTVFLEAACMLKTGDYDAVLCVIYDEPLPAPYPKGYLPTQAYGAAFVISQQADDALWQLELSFTGANGCNLNVDQTQTDTLRLLQFLLSTDTQLVINAPHHQWLWHKKETA